LLERIKDREYFTWATKTFVLALLYILSGKLGLLLAVPPGYATIIWPASGIAVGMLIMHGWRLWPGVLIGSFILNCHISGVFDAEKAFPISKIIVAFGIAAGSTMQAIIGRWFARKIIGIPLKLEKPQDIGKLFFYSGPLSCVVAASIGVMTLYVAGMVPTVNIFSNWLTWWLGDTFGILIFLPIVLLAPGSKNKLSWRGDTIGTLPVLAMLTLMVPVGLTFYAWKATSEKIYDENLQNFRVFVTEGEHLLRNKLETYNYALLGGVGLFKGSVHVSPNEWKGYVDAIEIQKNFPGINGLGLITPVEGKDISSFERQLRSEGISEFKVHPDTLNSERYVIQYIEPRSINEAAVGLDISFESSRRTAADLARDMNQPAITNEIALVQDSQKTPGFLLLQAFYRDGLPNSTIEERRKALQGWVYAPFIAKNFMKDVMGARQQNLHFAVYDGKQVLPEKLIYDDLAKENYKSNEKPVFIETKTIRVMQTDWTVVWTSTKDFERLGESESPFFILVGGLLFSGLFGLFLITATIKNSESIELFSNERNFALPIFILIVGITSSFYMYTSLTDRENKFIQTAMTDEMHKIEQLILLQYTGKISALERMGQRWIVSGGTPSDQWHADAKNYTNQLEGLKTLEWVDNKYTVRWVEPKDGNENIIGLNILFDKKREAALKGAAQKKSITITPPIDLVQGYKAFIAYMPLLIKNKFDGFMVGIFSTNDFFGEIISKEVSKKYIVSLSYEGKKFYSSSNIDGQFENSFGSKKILSAFDKKIEMVIVPTKAYIKSQRTVFPSVVLAAGLLISVLLFLSIRYILISKLKSINLRLSEETFRTAMENAPIGQALVSLEGKWLAVNNALCKISGYTEEELLAIDFQTITHPDDLEKDMEFVERVLLNEIDTYSIEKRYFHSDGHIIWALLTVSIARNSEGKPKYFISQIQDITERMRIDKMKSEFISTLSHELRTPLTSIRGALGLIEGRFSEELPAKVAHLISLAHKNCERLILLINDILDIDKISAGKMRFDMVQEDIALQVKQAIEINKSYGEKFNVNIKGGECPEGIIVTVDTLRLQQVLSNLISNAIKFSPSGNKVEVTITLDGQMVRVAIRDFGEGIPVETRPRIFEKFIQADSAVTRMKGGTGLGLYISKSIIEKMNGRIGFDTKLGKGTTFWLELPIFSTLETNDF
jgi:PAS domain S-box-containing protein